MEDIKEKTADEMFSKIGFSKIKDGEIIIYASYLIQVKFDNLDKTLIIRNNLGFPSYIDINILQAINKKCKEMNWLGDDK